MATRTNPKDDTISAIGNAMQFFDDNNLAELNMLKTFLQLKDRHLTAQKEFLAKKYGNDFEGIGPIDARLTFDAELSKALDAEVALSAINIPPFDKNSWRVQGFIYDANQKEIAQVMVTLVQSEKREPIKDSPSAVSDKNGFYAITLNGEQIKALKGVTVSLAVMTADQKLQVITESQLVPKIAKIDFFEIVLNQPAPAPAVG